MQVGLDLLDPPITDQVGGRRLVVLHDALAQPLHGVHIFGNLGQDLHQLRVSVEGLEEG